MTLQGLASLESWRGLVTELWWACRFVRDTGVLPPSWQLDSAWLARLRIRWPAQYQWVRAGGWVDPVLRGMQTFVRCEVHPIEQPYRGVVLLHVDIAGAHFPIAIDYSDKSTIQDECVRQCALYFKMQFSREGYSHEHVLPGGFVPMSPAIYRFLPHLRQIRSTTENSSDVYGRFSLLFASEVRKKASDILSQQSKFRYTGALKKLRYSRFLTEAARSKICIDLPGNGDFCFRLIDYLAIGACVVGPRHGTALHVPLEDGVHIAFAREDLSDLLDVCDRYLADPEARHKMVLSSQSFFDRYLREHQLGAYYLHSILGRLAKS